MPVWEVIPLHVKGYRLIYINSLKAASVDGVLRIKPKKQYKTHTKTRGSPVAQVHFLFLSVEKKNTLITQCKNVVTPAHKHCSYSGLAVSHPQDINDIVQMKN